MFRVRIAAGVAALALIGAAAFGGSMAASAAPLDAPVITLPPTGPDPDGQPFVQGDLTEDGLTVTVQVSNWTGTYTYCTDPLADIATGFACTSATPLPFGVNQFTATSHYTSGIPDSAESATSAAVDYTRWDPTGHVEITAGPPAVGADPLVIFSGTGPALGHVTLYEALVSADQVCATDVLEDGTWQCSLPLLTPGSYEVSIFGATTFYDGSGPVVDDTAAPYDFTIVPPPPVATVDQTFSPWITSSGQRAIQGNKDTDADYIQVYYAPSATGPWTGYCQTSGPIVGATIWFCDPPFGTLQPGTNYIAAVAFYSGISSATGPPITIERVAAPTIDSPVDAVFTNDSTPAFTGSSVSGGNATVYNDDDATTMCSTALVAGAFACDSAVTADGTYTYHAYLTPGDSIASATRTITIDTVAPTFPAITAPGVGGPPLSASTTDTTPTISGTGEPFATIVLSVDGSPAACVGGSPITTAGGAWSCDLTAALGLGVHAVATAQTDRATNSSGVSPTQLQLTITAIPLAAVVVPITTPIPTPTPSPVPLPQVARVWSLEVGGTSFEPGATTTLSGSGLPAGASVSAEFHSVAVALGATTVRADGTFQLEATIPLDAELGTHHLVATLTAPGEPVAVASREVTVVPAQKATAHPPEKTPLVDPGTSTGGDGATGAERNNPGAPSSFTHSIDTFFQVITNPVVIGVAAAAGLALLLFVAFPAELLNATLSEQYERIRRRIPPVKSPWFRTLGTWLKSTPLLGALIVTFLAAFIFGFADPGFGFDVTSARLVLACFIALFFVGYVASAIAGAIIGRVWRLDTGMDLKPLGVALAVVGVVISRLLEFSPGILIGLVLGIELLGKSSVMGR
ncbi:MAG: Ig-like domain-containing protein, partial [Rhodoglobus sp.]